MTPNQQHQSTEALAVDWLWQNISESIFWDKFPEESTLISGDIHIPLRHTAGWVEESPCAKNQLNLLSRFNTVLTCDRWTH